MKYYALTLLLTTGPIFAGTTAPTAPIAPAPTPQSNCEQGWTLGLEVLALKPYQSEGAYNQDGNWSAGYRGSLGYEFNDCVFTKATYFGYNTDGDDSVISVGVPPPTITTATNSIDLKVSYLDWVIGQHFKPSDKLTLSPFVGLRWGTFDETFTHKNTSSISGGGSMNNESESEYDFSGLGVVIGADGVLALGNNLSIYGTFKQSILFGTTQGSYRQSQYDVLQNGEVIPGPTSLNNSHSTDNVAMVTELGLGLQYEFRVSSVAANVRLGVEGQYWGGVSDGDSESTGLGGFVLGANFRF